METPVRRPVIRAVSFDDVAAALARLIPIVLPPTRAGETGASPRVADFLLAWWNGGENGHFPILHLCNLDETIGEDMLTILAYLAQNPVIYADQWGYRDTMAEIHERYRGQ